MVKILNFKAGLVSKKDISFLNYELFMYTKLLKFLTNLAHRNFMRLAVPLAMILSTAAGDLECG